MHWPQYYFAIVLGFNVLLAPFNIGRTYTKTVWHSLGAIVGVMLGAFVLSCARFWG